MDFSLRSGDGGKAHFGHPGWLGQGRVPRDILCGVGGTPLAPTKGSLVQRTKKWRDDAIKAGVNPAVIWAMHFDPFSTDGGLELLDSELLVDATRVAGVNAILCGHTHESKVKPFSPTTTVFNCGATSATGQPLNDFQVLEIDVPSAVGAVPKFEVMWYRYTDKVPNWALKFQKVMSVRTG
jgi:hypothetical protein